MIKMTVIGNLGKDALSNVVNGRTVINFSVAHTERFKDATGTTKDKTLWVECSYWTERMAILPYLKKGTLVYLEGTPDMRTYTTQDGRHGASLVLRISQIQLLSAKQNVDNTNNSIPMSGANPTSSNQFAPVPPISETPVEDDLPF
ncbi:MAG: single-stranded DNA-binding protein [Chitinophagaceae bacterium]